MIKVKEFNTSDSKYKEQMEQFQNEHPNAELFLKITGGHMSYDQILFRYEEGIQQSKYTIPKKIAELINTGDPLYLAWLYANELLVVNDDVALKKREDEIVRRKALVSAYLAGKALGVELVEVEG